MKIELPLKFCLAVYFAFIAFTIVGTVSHEFGHFIVGRALGYETTLHYAYTSFGFCKVSQELKTIYQNNPDVIKSGLSSPHKDRYDQLMAKTIKNNFWITLGGPFQTVLTGSIGLCLVLWRKTKKLYAKNL